MMRGREREIRKRKWQKEISNSTFS